MYRLIDHPAERDAGAYERALNEAVRRLASESGVEGIYQIGGVSTPGISDLDMVVVFGDDATCDGGVVTRLRSSYPYLFTHDLYGACLTHFRQAQRFSFFHNYRLLWGTDVRPVAVDRKEGDEALLKRQIALEYLVKLYVSMALQRAYRTIQVRSFLLHAKAVAYDLEFLDLSDGELFDRTHQFIAWRNAWFEAPPPDRLFSTTFDRYFKALVGVLEETLAERPFYLPGEPPYRVARNLRLVSGTELGYRRRGVRLPAALRVMGKRYVKLLNRLNRFDFTVPAASVPPPVLHDRFRLVAEMARHNRQRLPRFAALTSSL